MSSPLSTPPNPAPSVPDARGAALEVLPLAVAVWGPAGPVFRNAAHRALAPGLPESTPDGGADELTGLDIGQVTDPDSGRLYLRSRTPLADGPEPLVLEVLEDITGRLSDRDEIVRHRDTLLRHAGALERANRELAGLERTQAEFIALAAHELRTPLTALSSAVQLLRRALPGAAAGGDGADPERFLAMAERGVRRLTALADDLLDFTQMEARRLALAVAPTDLAALLAEAAERAEAEGAETGVRVARRASGPLPPLHGDPERLAQVVRQLVAHAVRRTPPGGAVWTSLCDLDRWVPAAPGTPDPPRPPGTPEGWLELVVEAGADGTAGTDGCRPLGALAADREAMPDGHAGMGVDLAVCRRIVALHGGAAWAETRAGRHRLVVRLPRLAPADARLLPLHEAWRWLRRHRDAVRVGVASADPGGPSPEALLAACRTACQGTGGAGDMAVAVPERGEVVAVVVDDDARAAVTRELNALAGTTGRSRDGGRVPIRVGWASAGPSPAFGDALERARAAARPLEPGPPEGEGDIR